MFVPFSYTISYLGNFVTKVFRILFRNLSVTFSFLRTFFVTCSPFIYISIYGTFKPLSDGAAAAVLGYMAAAAALDTGLCHLIGSNVPLLFIIRITVSDYSFGICWSLCCLSFDLRLLTIPLVSSNFPCKGTFCNTTIVRKKRGQMMHFRSRD